MWKKKSQRACQENYMGGMTWFYARIPVSSIHLVSTNEEGTVLYIYTVLGNFMVQNIKLNVANVKS